MHFWIDKHSQTCGFSGRHRFPTSISSSGGGGRRWRRAAKPMVTPVHRFQPIECVAGQYSSSHSHHGSSSNNSRRNPGAGGGGGELPVRAHAVELDSSVFLDLPLDGSTESNGRAPPQIEPVSKHSKCGMRLSFALATAIIGGARFYFEYQGIGIELVYTMLFVILISLCTVTIYRSVYCSARHLFSSTGADENTVPASSMQMPHQTALVVPLQVTSVIEETPPPAPPPLIEPPPPPYHIAVLLPQQLEDVPPPSYEKAVS